MGVGFIVWGWVIFLCYNNFSLISVFNGCILCVDILCENSVIFTFVICVKKCFVCYLSDI